MAKFNSPQFDAEARAYRSRTGCSSRAGGNHFGCSRTTFASACSRPLRDPPSRPEAQPPSATAEPPAAPEEQSPQDLQKIITAHLGMANQQAKAAFRENDMARLATAQKLAISCVQLIAKLMPEQEESRGAFVTHEKLRGYGLAAKEKLKEYARRGEMMAARCPSCGYEDRRSAFIGGADDR